jgi:hypothetical protein
VEQFSGFSVEDVSVASSRAPMAMPSRSLSKATEGLLSIGRESVLSDSVTPTASTRTKRVFPPASGVTLARASGSMVRVPRPFICSK